MMNRIILIIASLAIPALFGVRTAFGASEPSVFDAFLLIIAPLLVVWLLGRDPTYQRRTKWIWLCCFLILFGVAEWIGIIFGADTIHPDGIAVDNYGLRSVYPIIGPIHAITLLALLWSIIGQQKRQLRLVLASLALAVYLIAISLILWA